MALIESLNTGVSSIKAFSTGMKVVSNNIANVNSVGFKSSRVEYTDSFSNTLRRSAPSDGTGVGSNQVSKQIGTGVSTEVISSNFNQGSLEESGIATDLAITGEGFFTVEDSLSGKRFVTRAGNFRVDDSGYVVNSNGYRLQGLTGGDPSTAPSTLGDIQIAYTPASSGDPTFDNFTINTQGDVIFQLNDGSSFTSSTILLQRFQDPQALNAEGNGLYTGVDAAGAVGGIALSLANNEAGTNGLGTIRSGALELSNTDLTQEFANIIVAQRSFQAGARVVTVSDSIIEEIINLKR